MLLLENWFHYILLSIKSALIECNKLFRLFYDFAILRASNYYLFYSSYAFFLSLIVNGFPSAFLMFFVGIYLADGTIVLSKAGLAKCEGISLI